MNKPSETENAAGPDVAQATSRLEHELAILAARLGALGPAEAQVRKGPLALVIRHLQRLQEPTPLEQAQLLVRECFEFMGWGAPALGTATPKSVLEQHNVFIREKALAVLKAAEKKLAEGTPHA
jgi:hypothetical protein